MYNVLAADWAVGERVSIYINDPSQIAEFFSIYFSIKLVARGRVLD